MHENTVIFLIHLIFKILRLSSFSDPDLSQMLHKSLLFFYSLSVVILLLEFPFFSLPNPILSVHKRVCVCESLSVLPVYSINFTLSLFLFFWLMRNKIDSLGINTINELDFIKTRG